MASVQDQIANADAVICQNLAQPTDQRGFMSQNVLAQLRNLVEGLAVLAHTQDRGRQFDYSDVGAAVAYARATAKFRILGRFHGLVQSSASHYTLDRDPSERLMLKYYEYLLRTRDLALRELGLTILADLERFPVDLDPSLREYHRAIAGRVQALRAAGGVVGARRERYYLHGNRPFFVDGRIYYEVTFSVAHNRTSKTDRAIGFTDIDVTDRYAGSLELVSDAITVLGQTMPILLVQSWEVSIRPCEFDNFARLVGQFTNIRSNQSEYRNLMHYLTTMRSNLTDVVDLSDADYEALKAWALTGSQRQAEVFPVLDHARTLIRSDRPGSRLLRYLLLHMRNEIVKAQYDPEPCRPLSSLHVSWSCRPFDTMPFCTSPRAHNPRFADVAASIDSTDRAHELLARRIKNNVEQSGVIYTPVADVADLGDTDTLIATYNGLLPPGDRHAPRRLAHSHGHVFMVGYEDDAVAIINKVQQTVATGVAGHQASVEQWLRENPQAIDDGAKADALKRLFASSNVALVYGAAGTGKSTMVNHIATHFDADPKLFLAHTNPAVDNLKRRVHASNAEFSTVASHVWSASPVGPKYKVLVIDECSTLSNASLLKILNSTRFELLVLVGDVYQIESIEFGNWFDLIRSYIPQDAVFELTKPYRTNDTDLLTLWTRVRHLDDLIEESLSKNGYSKVLDTSLFQQHSQDEIVLCLNYDGLYGINNVNRFLQASNPNPPVTWSESTYKVGDPVLFNEMDRFRPVIFNNLKGTIVQIDRTQGAITFTVDLDRQLDAGDFFLTELRWLGGSRVQFDVFERGDTDVDDDTVNTLVPFQIAYAVSIHKAQGLEYDSVKVVITDANEERVSHAILYTALTRARRKLGVYWTPETQHRILSRLALRDSSKDEQLLKRRRGIASVSPRPKRRQTRQQP